MIYIEVSIEPENQEEATVVSISLMRMTEDKNELGEYGYNYGGWWLDRAGNKNVFHGKVYNKRENTIFTLVDKIVKDINNKINQE